MNPKVRYTGSCSGNHSMACLASLDAVDGLDGMERGYLGFIMGEPLSPDRVFDFPMDEPEPHPAYDFFAPEPLPGYADEPMAGSVVDEIAKPIVEMEEQVIAPVIDVEEDIAMLFDDDDFSDEDSKGSEDDKEHLRGRGPSTAAAKVHSLALPAPGFLVPLPVIEDLCTRMGNLEYGHRQLVKKVIQVSNAEVAEDVAIGEIDPRVSVVEGQMQAATQRDETIEGLSQHMHTLQATVHHRDVQIQQLQALVSEMSSCESTLMQCILGMDKRVADLERRPLGPQ
ncbi:hypothetical protein Tco_0223355 [Tanacetum coccineum]